MLKILCRYVRCVQVTRQLTPLVQHAQSYAAFTLRDVLSGVSDETGTLLIRFAKHIAIERYNCDRTLVPTKIRYSNYFPISEERYFCQELRKTPADQLPALIIFASTYRSNAQPPKYAFVLNEIDQIATFKLPEMDIHTVLETLYSLLFLMPNWIMRLDFYKLAMQRLVKDDFIDAKNSALSKETFVQVCFYLGLGKKQSRSGQLLESFLKMYIETYLPELTKMDLAIVCNAAYKASVVIDNAAYVEQLKQAVQHLKLEKTNDALLVTYIKAMRLQRVQSEEISRHLATICADSKKLEIMQLNGMTHLFAYFAEQQWDHKDSCDAISKAIMNQLQSERLFDVLRPKDLATFLWCCTQLNCNLTTDQLQRIESIVLDKLNYGQYNYFADNLVDTTLSLWQFGHRSRELLEAAYDIKHVQSQRHNKPQPKVDSRLTVLLSAAAIEEPNWIKSLRGLKHSAFNPKTAAPSHLLNKRTDLTSLHKQLKEDQDVADVNLVCPINGINIPGLLVQSNNGEEVFVESVTDGQSLVFSKAPCALLELKKRLLEVLGYRVIMLSSSDLVNTTSFKDLLENKGDESIEDRKPESVRN